MSASDYLHCDRCAALWAGPRRAVADGKASMDEVQPGPGWKMIYMGDTEISPRAGMPAIFCERCYGEHLADCRMTMIRAVVAAQWAVAVASQPEWWGTLAPALLTALAELPTAEQIVDGAA